MEDREQQKDEWIQVNIELTGATAEAFKRYKDSMGLHNNAPAGRSLLIQQLRALGYLSACDQPADREQTAIAA